MRPRGTDLWKLGNLYDFKETNRQKHWFHKYPSLSFLPWNRKTRVWFRIANKHQCDSISCFPTKVRENYLHKVRRRTRFSATIRQVSWLFCWNEHHRGTGRKCKHHRLAVHEKQSPSKGQNRRRADLSVSSTSSRNSDVHRWETPA